MVRFWIVTGILCAVGFALYYRYFTGLPLSALPQRVRRARARALGRGGARGARAARRRGRARSTASSGTTTTSSLLDGVGARRQEPGRARRERRSSSRRARRGIPVWSEVELGYRLLAAAARRRHRHERQDDDVRAARRDPRRGRRSRATSAGALTELDGAVEPGALVVCELSSFQLEDVHELALRGRRPAEPRARPPRPPRHLRGLPRREAADLRARARDRSCRAGSGPARGSSSRADDPLPAEPRIRGAHNRENAAAATAAARALGIADEAIARGAARRSRACRTASSSCASVDGVRYVNDSKATNVAAALRALAAYADEPVRLILGGSRKGEDFAPLAAALGPNVRSGLPDRRGGGRARGALDPAGRSSARTT